MRGLTHVGVGGLEKGSGTECSGEMRDQVDVNLYLEKSDRTRDSGAWGGGISGVLGGRGTTTGRTSSGEGGNRSQVEALRRQGRGVRAAKAGGHAAPNRPPAWEEQRE